MADQTEKPAAPAATPEPAAEQAPNPAQPPAQPSAQPPALPKEIGGRQGPEPTRFGDWEKGGRCIDF